MCRLIDSPIRDVISPDPWLVKSNGLYPCVVLSKYYKCVSFHNLTNPYADFSRSIPFAKSRYPTLTDHLLRPVIHHEPKFHIHNFLMTENECPNFCFPKCPFAQFSKPNPNPVYGFLMCFLAGKFEKETLIVNIFWLGIFHKTRSDKVQECEIENQCSSF